MRYPVLLAACLWLVSAPLSRAEIEFGPWRFPDGAFADAANQLDSGDANAKCAADVDEALTGFSPGRLLINIGFDTNAATFLLEFLEFPVINDEGADLVFFDAAFSSIVAYDIALRPLGEPFTAALTFDRDDFVATGESDVCGGLDYGLRGLPIEADDFGLPTGTVIDALRFTAASSDPDPVMAGALNLDVIFADSFEP